LCSEGNLSESRLHPGSAQKKGWGIGGGEKFGHRTPLTEKDISDSEDAGSNNPSRKIHRKESEFALRAESIATPSKRRGACSYKEAGGIGEEKKSHQVGNLAFIWQMKGSTLFARRRGSESAGG